MKQNGQWVGLKGFSMRSFIVSSLAILVVLSAGRSEAFEGAAPAAAGEEQADAWRFNVAAYIWGSSIKGQTRAGDDIDVGFSDILDKLKLSGMGLASARKGKFVVFGDAIYLKLEDDLHVPPASGNLTMQTWITEMAAGYTVYEQDAFSVDVFGGARYLGLDIEVDTLVAGVPFPVDLQGSDGVWNGIVGLKGIINLPKQWFGSYYFDIGTGETKRTYQMMGVVGYRINRLSLVGGYRYLRYDFDTTDTFGKIMDHLEIQGPIAGLMYTF